MIYKLLFINKNVLDLYFSFKIKYILFFFTRLVKEDVRPSCTYEDQKFLELTCFRKKNPD